MIRLFYRYLSAVVVGLSTISGAALSGSMPPAAPVVIKVPGDQPTIQAAIDSLGPNADYTQIQIAAGEYKEIINIQQISGGQNLESRTYELGENGVPNGTTFTGLQIMGDMRPCFPQYQNGYRHAANSDVSTLYELKTNDPNVGPYPVLVSSAFGVQPKAALTLPAAIADPILGSPPPITVNPVGSFAIMRRGGGIGFATKTKNAQDAGALASIIVDNQAVGVSALGGSDSSITIPAFSISKANGDVLIAAVTANPGLVITVEPPRTFYNPPIGTNYAPVVLSHPNGDRKRIKVTINPPLPVVDPSLPRGVAPVLEQPVFSDPRLNLLPPPGATWKQKVAVVQIAALGETDKKMYILEVEGFEISNDPVSPGVASPVNVIVLSTPVPDDLDINALGSSLTFLPNVRIAPAAPRLPVITAQSLGFSMSGIWIDTAVNDDPETPALPFAATTTGLMLGKVQANLSNIIISDSRELAANGFGFNLQAESTVNIIDGFRNSSANRRLSVLNWSAGLNVVEMSRLSGPLVFTGGLKNTNALALADNSFVSIDALVLIGNEGLFQAGSTQLSLTGDSTLISSNLLTVADVFGSGISLDNSQIDCGSFVVERVYKPSGGIVETNAINLTGTSTFRVFAPNVYLGDPAKDPTAGQPTSLIENFSVVRNCFNIDPAGKLTAGTTENVGIFVADSAKFISEKDLVFSGNDVDYLTLQDAQFITPAWLKSPGNTFLVAQNGPLNSVFQFQKLDGKDLHLTLDPSTIFQYQGVYINKANPGKSFTLFSENGTDHQITLTHGSFVGTKSKTIKFCKVPGAFVKLKILSPSQVLIEGGFGVRLQGDSKCPGPLPYKCDSYKKCEHHSKHSCSSSHSSSSDDSSSRSHHKRSKNKKH